MKVLAFFLLALPCVSINAQSRPTRPPIVGIGSVRIALTDPSSFVKFYVNELGFGGGLTVCNGASNTCVEVNKNQRIDLNSPRHPVESSGCSPKLILRPPTSSTSQLSDGIWNAPQRSRRDTEGQSTLQHFGSRRAPHRVHSVPKARHL